jgi:hypothetical protein
LLAKLFFKSEGKQKKAYELYPALNEAFVSVDAFTINIRKEEVKKVEN